MAGDGHCSGRQYLLQPFVGVGPQACAQAFVAGHQLIERSLQRDKIQLALEPYGHGQVVGRALWVQLPQERHAPLCIREPVTAGLGDIARDRKHGKIHPLSLQRGQEQTAFFRRQFNEAASEFQRIFGIHAMRP